MDIEIFEFNPISATEDLWKQYHSFRRVRFALTHPGDPVTPDEVITQARKTEMDNPDAYLKRFYLYVDGNKSEIAAMYTLNTIRETSENYKSNGHILQTDIEVIPKYANQGLGTRILEKVKDYAVEREKSTILGKTSETSGKQFLIKIGAQLALEGAENRLHLDNINWKMIDKWITNGPQSSPQSTLRHFDIVPDDLIEHYAKVYSETMSQQPFEDLDVQELAYSPESVRAREQMLKQMGGVNWVFITQEPDGEISGLTELLYIPKRPLIAQQGLTGVRSHHRGKGLGKWLKAYALKALKERFEAVGIVSTDNATSNAPMLSINTRLGFEKHKESHFGQIKLDKLKEYLQSQEIVA